MFDKIKNKTLSEGRKILLQNNYKETEDGSNKTQYTIFTKWNKDENRELSKIAYVTEVEPVENDEPSIINERWEQLPTWGGVRQGAGRKPTGRKRQSFYITDKENELLRKYLNKLRESK